MIEEMEDAAATGLRCPRCAADNQRTGKFCSKCGAPLWEACFNCGETCAAGEEFCAACGANIGRVAAENIERVENELREAERLWAECRFEEAIVLLGAVGKNKHPRVFDQARRAAEMLKQASRERVQRRNEAETARQRAEILLAEFDYEAAARALEAVSPPLRSDQIKGLLTRSRQCRREIAALEAEIRDDAQHKRIDDLLTKIERLLALQPRHAEAMTLAEKVQQRIAAAAEKALNEHRYERAVQLLERIPPKAGDAGVVELLRRARETACLARDLRNAPVVDQTLFALAERMRLLSPSDATMRKLHDELQRRRRAAAARSAGQPLAWANPPKNTPLGAPVEWLASFHRISSIDSPETADLHRHPGRFAAACGLALAGVGGAAVDINLSAVGRLGMLGRVARLVRAKTARSAWGIDLGTSALKAVKLAWDAAKCEAIVEAALLIEHAKPLNHAANEVEESKLVVDTLKTLLGAWALKGERVCAGLPGRVALCRQFELPPADAAKAGKLVEFEARLQLNIPLEQLIWDYHPFDAAAAERPARETGRALLVAAKRHAVERFVESFRRAGLRIDVLQPDFIALHNLLLHDCLGRAPDAATSRQTPVAALDVGCAATSIIVSAPRSLWFLGSGIAGESFTRALVKEFRLSFAQAEKLKRSVESAENVGELYRQFEPLFDGLLRDTQHFLDRYSREASAGPVETIFGLGGGFALHGLFRYLRCGQ